MFIDTVGRELEIIRSVLDNLTEAATAAESGVSERTIHGNLRHLFKDAGDRPDTVWGSGVVLIISMIRRHLTKPLQEALALGAG